MINQIRNSRLSKIIASYLAIQMIVSIVQPNNIYALTGGPSQPEFNSFTPIGTSDMVNLSTGDFNYNIPIMDVGGYPLNLSYESGVTMDQEASWVGLGWNLNVGQINRQVRGIPDDFKGDELKYEDYIKPNKTTGLTFNINPQFVGLGDMGLGVSAGMTFQHNNYNGISFVPSYGISFEITKNISVGANLTSSAENGASVNPYISLSEKVASGNKDFKYGMSASFGVGYNSRQGLTSFNMSSGYGVFRDVGTAQEPSYKSVYSQNGHGSISFINNTFTPSKRVAYKNSNISFAFSLGPDIWGIDAEFGVSGFGSVQKLKNEDPVLVKSYGYNNTHLSSSDDVLDFNREKEDLISKNTLVLPVTNYTYDIYAINGQGTGGMFRPYRGQVGYVYSSFVQDESNSDSFGGEIEGGAGWHVGVDFTNIDAESSTGKWETPVTTYFDENNNESNEIDYERVYYKTVGEYTVDNEFTIFKNSLGGNNAIRIGIGGQGNSPGKYAVNKFEKKPYSPGDDINFNQKIKRNHRELRNKAIIPVTMEEAGRDGLINEQQTSSLAKPHHIVAYKTLNPDGSTYIYGESVYNTKKVESTFATDKAPDIAIKGTVGYTSNDEGKENGNGIDHYFNRITTPPYAHTYLLTSVLSADYEDLEGNGPSDDDLGSYTKFNYKMTDGNYHWSIPYTSGKASYNQGLNSNSQDQKASLVYGEKELKYIKTIETKTHIAYFRLSARQDGKESGGGASSMQQIDKIFLFSKPEYKDLTDNGNIDPDLISISDLAKVAIKVAHFRYVYTLCPGIPNGNAKLTLETLYFTYRDSFMGKYTPYTFSYGLDIDGDGVSDNNYPYSLKAYDIWGNYKPNEATTYDVFANGSPTPLSPQEFPFVQQDDKELQDLYASAWSLSSIHLPSGGKIDVEYETDDYQYVQDRKVMQMFKVVGATESIPNQSNYLNKLLYQNGNNGGDAKYLIVELPEAPNTTLTGAEFQEKYLGDQFNKPIYFRFMLNMSKDTGKSTFNNDSNDFEYVTGYFLIDSSIPDTFTDGASVYGIIPMQFTDLEGGVNGGKQINPISKAGLYFGRKYLHRKVYGLPLYSDGTSVKDVITQLKSDIGALSEIISGPNAKLRNQNLIARRFIPEKSWIRLLEPTGRKMGGGVRVKRVVMDDQWEKMLSSTNPEYNQTYGQEYSYTLENGTSSGVATYEPNMSKENPFVEPFYNSNIDNLVAPRELNYVEKPFGESFFPSPVVTYSKVEVKNLPRSKNENGETLIVKKHATGKVVNEFYTSKDFPTIVDYTSLNGPDNYYSNDDDIIGQTLGSLLGLNVEVTTELTLSQGFSIQTNDMNGKQKKQSVFNEYGQFISGVEYKYRTNEIDGTLDNKVPTIKENGVVESEEEVGMHYEVINDFQENRAYSKTLGAQGNVAALPFGPFVVVVPMIVPQSAEHTNTFHGVTTTKVIHRTGIMTEKIAYDVGSSVSTKNIAWDSSTGEVLLTETVNEYNDHYFNFTYPAHWYYKGMGMASQNIGIEGTLSKIENQHTINVSGASLSDIFTLGDEIETSIGHLWVAKIENNNLILIDRDGILINDSCDPLDIEFKIVRSGYRNQQTASMASVTSMINPININSNTAFNNITEDSYFYFNGQGVDHNIINASAVEYGEAWPQQWENGLPGFPNALISKFDEIDYEDEEAIAPYEYGFNPYLFNVRGEWRAKKSYAYLTGRNNNESNTTPLRHEGYFNKFKPLYRINNTTLKWYVDNSQNIDNHWTFASQVSQYSPYGAELENKDALGRYSAAQYGYNYTLPTAVASNSEYRQMGFDSFEDYDYAEENSNSSEPYNSHFSYFDVAYADGGINGGNIKRTAITSHTGKYSIAVSPNTSASLYKSLSECELTIIPAEEDCGPDPDPIPCSFADTKGLECELEYQLPLGNVEITDIEVIGECSEPPGTEYNVQHDFSDTTHILSLTTILGSACDQNPYLSILGTIIVKYKVDGQTCTLTITIHRHFECD